MGGQKGPIWPKTGPNWEKSSEGQIWGQTWSQLPLIGPTGLESWLPHTLAWYRASSGPPGTPKGPILAENVPFGGSGGTPRAPGGHTWSQLPPIGLTGLESWLPHPLAWYWATSWPLRGPKWARFGPKYPFGESWRYSESPEGPDLVPTPTGCYAGAGLMVTTDFSPFVAPKGPI